LINIVLGKYIEELYRNCNEVMGVEFDDIDKAVKLIIDI